MMARGEKIRRVEEGQQIFGKNIILIRISSCAPTRVPSRQEHVIPGSARTAVKYEVGAFKWTKSLRAAEKRARGDHRSVPEPTPSSLVATPCEVCGETKGVLVSIKALPRQLVATSSQTGKKEKKNKKRPSTKSKDKCRGKDKNKKGKHKQPHIITGKRQNHVS